MNYLRSLFLIIMVTICLWSSGFAVAAPYESECNVSSGSHGDSGTVSASYSYGNSTLDARADGWELGTRVNYHIASGDDQARTNVATAGFQQEFNIIDPEVESVLTLSYEGSMTVSGTDVDLVNARYSSVLSIYIDEYTSSGKFIGTRYENEEEAYIDNEDGFGVFNFSGTFEVVYVPDNLVVGDSNDLPVYDSVLLGVEIISDILFDEDIVFLSEAGLFSLDNNFLNTVKLESVTGGIEVVDATVPVPGAVWLLGAGLVGLLGVRRKH